MAGFTGEKDEGIQCLVSTDRFNPDVQKPCNLSTCVTIFGNF